MILLVDNATLSDRTVLALFSQVSIVAIYEHGAPPVVLAAEDIKQLALSIQPLEALVPDLLQVPRCWRDGRGDVIGTKRRMIPNTSRCRPIHSAAEWEPGSTLAGA